MPGSSPTRHLKSGVDPGDEVGESQVKAERMSTYLTNQNVNNWRDIG